MHDGHRDDEQPEDEQPERTDLGYTRYVLLGQIAGVDWRTIRAEWRRPGSVRGMAGVRARETIATVLATSDGDDR